MQQSGPYYILKVLSGPHLGAEVRLAEGDYRIGRDESCDIVLSDRSLAGEHALIAIARDGIRAQSLAGEVRLNNRPHTEPGKLLPFFTVLSLGTTHLAVGAETATWPELVPPSLPALAAPPEAEPSAPGDGSAAAGAAPASNGQAAAVPVPVPPRAVAARSSVGRWTFRAAVVLLLLGIVTAVGASRSGNETPSAMAPPGPSAPLPPTPGQQLGKLLASRGWGPEVTVAEDQRGRVMVDGHVDTRVELAKLTEEVKQASVPAQLQIYSGEEMVEGAEQTLQALGYELQVTYAGNGMIRLQGYIPDASNLQRVSDIVQRDVAGLAGIRNEVLTDRGILGSFEAEVKAAGLGNIIQLRLDKDHKVVARGTARPEDMQKWAQLQASFDQRYGRYLQIVSQVGETRHEAPPAGVQLNVRAVAFGDVPFVVLGDGEKYLEGSVLTDGWTIVKISPKEIVLSKGGQRYVHEL
jgi:type III secretion system YscD/HrpQ family protein